VERPWNPSQRRWRFDPANSEARLAYHALRDRLEGRQSDVEALSVPGSRYIDFLLPGLMALGLVNSCLWGVGWGLVEMRQKRLLRLMLATPMRPGIFFGSLFAARLILTAVEAAIVFAFSAWIFDVRVHGSWLALAALWTCGAAAFFGLAVLVACRTDRPAVGQGLVNAVTLPMFVVSGVFFGLDNFAPKLQKVFRLFPPTLLVDGTRAVVNGGAGLPEMLPTCLALLGLGVLFFGVGRRFFRFY
jgi:ABC-type multidrug transport system permease subunit